MHDSAQSLLLLINDILDFSKIEAGRLDLERAPFHVAECVEAALELVAADAAAKDLELLCVIEPGTPDALVGDADAGAAGAAQPAEQRGEVHRARRGAVTVARGHDRSERRRVAATSGASRCATPASASPPTAWSRSSSRSPRSTRRRPGATAAPAWAWPSAAGCAS